MADNPDDPLYTLAVFPPFLLAKLAECVQRHGLDVDRLCLGLGFASQDLTDPGLRVSYRQAELMIRRAIAALPDRGLGLEVGSLNVVGTLGLVGHAISLSRNLRQAWEIGIEYQVLTGGMALHTYGGADGLVWSQAECRLPDPRVRVFAIEESFSSFVVYFRALASAEFKPVRVEVDYPAPRYVDDYARVFGAPIRFGAAHNRFIVPETMLDEAFPGHDPVALNQILAVLERERVTAVGKLDLVQSVERALINGLTDGPNIERIAAGMNMSERTLRRRLAEHDLSFDALLDNVRRTRAVSLLANAEMTIEMVAERSGYGDVRSFRRAFQRWTGMGPREFRNQ